MHFFTLRLEPGTACKGQSGSAPLMFATSSILSPAWRCTAASAKSGLATTAPALPARESAPGPQPTPIAGFRGYSASRRPASRTPGAACRAAFSLPAPPRRRCAGLAWRGQFQFPTGFRLGRQSHVPSSPRVTTSHSHFIPDVSYVPAAFSQFWAESASLPRKPRFLQQKGARRTFGVRQG